MNTSYISLNYATAYSNENFKLNAPNILFVFHSFILFYFIYIITLKIIYFIRRNYITAVKLDKYMIIIQENYWQKIEKCVTHSSIKDSK